MKRGRRSSLVEHSDRTDAWHEALTAQCTDQLYDVGRRFAARRAAVVARCGGRVDDYYIRELVANVISDTAAGTLCWDPAVQNLEAHVLDAISRRANHDCSRAFRYRHEAVDFFDPETPRTLVEEVEAKLADAVPRPGYGLEAELERVKRLRELAGPEDVHVQFVLDAFEAGASTKSDVLHFTGLSDKEYRAARKRLMRLVAKLAPGEPSNRRRSRDERDPLDHTVALTDHLPRSRQSSIANTPVNGGVEMSQCPHRACLDGFSELVATRTSDGPGVPKTGGSPREVTT